ncbi:peroxiredoxin-like 2A isoform X2 [Hyperolius riggenbachi]|uniref:peroxiredoxin-like 2A isoform X2 n=1 Tax=Hyperolius riggenbachi TaxID=752182 RepID=UPI0035A36C1D
MWILPESEIFIMGLWSISIGALGAAVAGIILANTDYFLPKTEGASLEYLANADLKTITDESRTFKAKELWEKNGAVIMVVRRPGCFLCREVTVKQQMLQLCLSPHLMMQHQLVRALHILLCLVQEVECVGTDFNLHISDESDATLEMPSPHHNTPSLQHHPEMDAPGHQHHPQQHSPGRNMTVLGGIPINSSMLKLSIGGK